MLYMQGTDADPTENPHNQILLLLVEFGVVGFAVYAALLVTQWRVAARMARVGESSIRLCPRQ